MTGISVSTTSSRSWNRAVRGDGTLADAREGTFLPRADAVSAPRTAQTLNELRPASTWGGFRTGRGPAQARPGVGRRTRETKPQVSR
ncbi:hypothetical protein GCM10010341_77410 [Streptomyces noursei]|nr:hypothetical protein GCM10010341_77410 [Streptomyces noursei]